ncbi:MAG TPA: HD domain-containing protein [bacterium]|nr:HD domain-containing protein [bacterium]
MELLDRFSRFSRHFANAPQLHGSPQNVLMRHAEHIQDWLDLTQSLSFMTSKEKEFTGDILESAIKSSRALFLLGDEISAWVGQENIAAAARRHSAGIHAAQCYASAARYAVYQFLLDEAETALKEMRRHFKETDHPQAAQYWELSGMILALRKKWTQALPYFQLAREHIEFCSVNELKRWMKASKNDMKGHQNLRMVDCLICHGWSLDAKDRGPVIRDIRNNLNTARHLTRSTMLLYLTKLNEVELMLLENDLDAAEKQIDALLDSHNVESRKTSILHPGGYVMKARVADIRGDQTAMISYLSRALAESTIMFPDVMQELQVVDYAFSMIQRNAMTRRQWQPLLEAMVLMLEAKDWYTGRDHSKSVARTAVRLWNGWHNNNSDPTIPEDLYWAAYLHDIGKLLLPRSLLNKIAPLGASEWRIIRRHPVYTRDMLRSLVQ